MERNITTQVNRHMYSYQQSVNNATDFTNLSNGLANILNSQQHNVGTMNSENANLLEILQSATDDSKNEESSGNNENRYGENGIDSDFGYDITSSLYQDYSSGNEFSNEDYIDTRYKLTGRAATAPTKPKNEAEEFKYSSQFAFLEKLAQYSRTLTLRSDGKFEIESEEGAEVFKLFLERLELLIKVIIVFYFYRQ